MHTRSAELDLIYQWLNVLFYLPHVQEGTVWFYVWTRDWSECLVFFSAKMKAHALTYIGQKALSLPLIYRNSVDVGKITEMKQLQTEELVLN